jgi:heparan-alpha-glucosaminide N-acetyltransferase
VRSLEPRQRRPLPPAVAALAFNTTDSTGSSPVTSVGAVDEPLQQQQQRSRGSSVVVVDERGNGSSSTVLRQLADVLPYSAQWLLMLLLPIVHVAITFALDVPGCGRGYVGAGGIGDLGRFDSCTGGAAGYIDRLVFGESHIYTSPTCQELYRTGSYDPEGLLGNLTSVFMCFLGVQLGRTLLTYKSHGARLGRFAVWALLLGVPAIGLCGATMNDGLIPINKNLWSLSFVLALAALANVAFALFYVAIDQLTLWSGAPFTYLGANSIVIYCGSEILQPYFPFSYELPTLATHAETLVQNLVGITCWIALAAYMSYCEFFINI